MRGYIVRQLSRGLFVLAAIVALATFVIAAAEPEEAARFAPRTRVMLFSADRWAIAEFQHAQSGNEFLHNNRLYRVLDSQTAKPRMTVTTSKLFEADRVADDSSRKPAATDVVQVLSKELRFIEHSLLKNVPLQSTIRFQGRLYNLQSARSLKAAGNAPPHSAVYQHIQITRSSTRHIIDRHTVGGSKSAGASIFLPSEDIDLLIRQAELVTPVLEENGYVSREFDAGRPIGTDGRTGKQTSTYRVISTRTGKLVTAYPVLRRERD